ncbi:interferon-induced protein with tetratricopeptide repeats 1B-like [Acipenser ruthenus]|uniref:interferon-induced protein with tetratricopeptide repeats 1B-like n=1 Tax=Acipenser ruthenus TaxID=7906 RepID=UPI0027416742|nr:interferon-induced protein with tetratricopeptide repeats 1B-like [Acipenser ruthenus]
MTIHENIDFSVVKYKGKLYNYHAYVKHLKGFNEEALKYLEQAEEIAKKDHEDEFEKLVIVTYGNFAWVYYHMAELTKAQSYLEKLEDICKTFPTASRYSVLLPVVYGEKGWSFFKVCDEKHYKIAKECFERALEEEPDEKEWNADYAIVLYRLETFGPSVCAEDSVALKQLQHALELDPENSVLMVYLGIKLHVYEQNEEALKLVNQALRLSPNNPYIIRHAARFFRKCGCPDKSLEILKEALQAAPDSYYLHSQLGLTYKSKIGKFQGQWNQDPTEVEKFVKLSILYFEKAVRMKPSSIQDQVDLAHMYAESGDIKKAEDIYQKLFEMPVTWLDDIQTIHFCFGSFQFHYKKSEPDAIKHYKIGLQIQNTSSRGNQCYAQLQKIARRRIARNPRNAEGFAILGSAHQLRKELPEALDNYEKALQLDPGNERYKSTVSDLCVPIICSTLRNTVLK